MDRFNSLISQTMNPDQITQWNAGLRRQTPLEIVRWAVARANGRAVVSTNFRPYEAVILHLCTQVQPDIPVLWVDHGYNRPATYQPAVLRDRRRHGGLSHPAQPAERMGLFRPGQGRREARVRPARGLGTEGSGLWRLGSIPFHEFIPPRPPPVPGNRSDSRHARGRR